MRLILLWLFNWRGILRFHGRGTDHIQIRRCLLPAWIHATLPAMISPTAYWFIRIADSMCKTRHRFRSQTFYVISDIWYCVRSHASHHRAGPHMSDSVLSRLVRAQALVPPSHLPKSMSAQCQMCQSFVSNPCLHKPTIHHSSWKRSRSIKAGYLHHEQHKGQRKEYPTPEFAAEQELCKKTNTMGTMWEHNTISDKARNFQEHDKVNSKTHTQTHAKAHDDIIKRGK